MERPKFTAVEKVLQRAVVCPMSDLVELCAETGSMIDSLESDGRTVEAGKARVVCRCLESIGSLRFAGWDAVSPGIAADKARGL